MLNLIKNMKNVEIEKRINEFLKKYEMVGSSIIIANKKDIIASSLYGKESIEKEKETTLNTVYRIASISKVIVAIGVMKLVEEGKIDLKADISLYLGFKLRNPFFPDDKITTEMIMTQCSSITDYGEGTSGYDAVNQFDDEVLLSDLLTNPESKYYTKKTFINHAPGTYWRYSNLGCGILACLIEKVSGRYFTDYIKDELLKPLEIYSGFRLEDIKNIDNLAGHYIYHDGKFILYRDYDKFKQVQCLRYSLGNNFRGVAGGLYISSLDLCKIMQMLMNDGVYGNVRILKEETVKEMKKIHWDGKTEDPTYYKKGLQMIILDQFTEKPLMGHFGNAYGLRSFMLFNEEIGYIFLCNGANFLTDEEHMTRLQKELIEFLVSLNL